jgi:hypothetical protein
VGLHEVVDAVRLGLVRERGYWKDSIAATNAWRRWAASMRASDVEVGILVSVILLLLCLIRA